MKSIVGRRDFLKTLGLGAAALGMPGGCSRLSQLVSGKKVKQPNIIFIMLDDLGKEWVHCYGSEENLTPNVDNLARQGIQFSNAYCMPQCTPTRVTLLTGQYPFRHGWVNHWDVPRWGAGCHFDENHNYTFARLLKSAGYATCAAGKWQIDDFRVKPDAMERHGFDEYCMWTGYESQNKPSAKRYWDPYIHSQGKSKTYTDKFGEDVFCDFIIDFMKRNKDKPMMVYYPMCLTHGPLTDTPQRRSIEGKYPRHRAMVRYTDFILGKIVRALEEMGIRENTIIFWTTDNGSGGSLTGRIGSRQVKGGKTKLSENGVNVPFIVNGPGIIPAGAKTDALTDFTDMLPTFAELAGVSVPQNIVVDGVSLAGVIRGKTKDSPRKWILAMGGHPGKVAPGGRVANVKTYADRVIRDKQYKLLVKDGQSNGFYDLISDPFEENNLIENQNPTILTARKKLEAVIKSLPETDVNPIYDPTTPQPWDKKPKDYAEK